MTFLDGKPNTLIMSVTPWFSPPICQCQLSADKLPTFILQYLPELQLCSVTIVDSHRDERH